jgi:TonB-linked SusC/RagA family outer membrane protein
LAPTDVALAATSGKWDYDFTNANVNWLKEYYKEWSPSQEHNISISGGSPQLTYYISSNILTQEGFMRYGTEDFDRYTTTGKLSSQLTKNIKVDYTTRFVRSEYTRPTAMNDDFYNQILRRARPTRAITDPNGNYMADINYILTMKEGGTHKEQNDLLTQQGRITITPAKDWNIIGEFNFKTDNNWTHWDQKKVFSHYANNPQNTYLALTSPANDVVYEYAFRSTFINPNIYSNYTKQIDNHSFTVLAGTQSEQYNQRLLSAQRNDMISVDYPIIDLTTNNTSTLIKGNYQKWATLGYFGRLNYDYEGRYLAELNIRYDGTSRYREDMRWIWTPSASIGWNMAKEAFFKNLTPYVSLLKLRASYGVLGNQNTTNYYPTYLTIGNGAASGNWPGEWHQPNTATAPAEIISSLLTWEKVKTTNLGVDFRLSNNRLSGSFDYYVRNTVDMIGAGVELPVTLGLGSPAFNNTDLRTAGWELDLGWKDKKGEFSYGIRVNISDALTKITKYGNPTGTLSKYVGDQYIGNIYGYTTIGIAKTNDEMNEHLATLPNGAQNALGSSWAAGDIMFKDLNNDGKINNGSNTIHDMGDMKKIGNNTPRFRTGINVDVAYKGFDMQMFWQGVLKRDFYPTGMVFWGATGAGQWWSTALEEHLDYFREDANHPLGQNIDSYYPRPLFNGKNQVTQTKYLQNASYMRLKNLQVGYTFKQSWLNVVRLQSLRTFVSGENLLTFTKLSKTMDPETAGIGAQGGTVYPLSKTYSFGISANF